MNPFNANVIRVSSGSNYDRDMMVAIEKLTDDPHLFGIRNAALTESTCKSSRCIVGDYLRCGNLWRACQSLVQVEFMLHAVALSQCVCTGFVVLRNSARVPYAECEPKIYLSQHYDADVCQMK